MKQNNDDIKFPVKALEGMSFMWLVDAEGELLLSIANAYRLSPEKLNTIRDEVEGCLNGYGEAVKELKYLLTMWEGDNDPCGYHDGLIQTLKDLGELDEQEDTSTD